ncbi:hypothetical protein HO173_011172 [Letharia columbiana]|uniref:DUF952 domain protein n=1 Tax=Letharia columbiana TaxID=112416 RepID=A0A8H6FLB3_9LECA|nr:uncharacterized protein HO173_011172 [Letharia columbiana]KAF6230635.1 hypothetical protein HO173_011172 [Letharia columbiana]
MPPPPPSPSSLPKYVYKILPEAPPDPLPASLPLSAIDAQDGFIHLSTAAQTPATAGRFFSANEKLWVLRIPLKQIESNVKWEEAKSGCFAHLYGADLGQMEIEDTKAFTRGESDDWTAILEKDEWLS